MTEPTILLSDVETLQTRIYPCRWCNQRAVQGFELALGFPIGRLWVYVCDVHAQDVNHWLQTHNVTDSRALGRFIDEPTDARK